MPDDSLVLTPALVVEDDLSMQRRIARLLGDVEPGAEVVVTGSLVAARELLAAREFSIALVAIGLPDGNGCELIAWLNRPRPDMQVLVISAWGDEDTVLSPYRSGAIVYLRTDGAAITLPLSLQS